MKTAIYIEDGTVQLVITPENAFEKNALTMFKEKPLDVQMFTGSFYDCRGGWVRQTKRRNPLPGLDENEDQSIILRVNESSTKGIADARKDT